MCVRTPLPCVCVCVLGGARRTVLAAVARVGGRGAAARALPAAGRGRAPVRPAQRSRAAHRRDREPRRGDKTASGVQLLPPARAPAPVRARRAPRVVPAVHAARCAVAGADIPIRPPVRHEQHVPPAAPGLAHGLAAALVRGAGVRAVVLSPMDCAASDVAGAAALPRSRTMSTQDD